MLRKLDANLILLSMHDLLSQLREQTLMSDVQRVQVGLALHVAAQARADVGFMVNDVSARAASDEFLLIDDDDFVHIVTYASGERVDHHYLRLLIERCERRAVTFSPKAGHTIIVPGSFWRPGNTPDRYIAARRDGVRIGVYVHDIVPLTHPEYCMPDLVRDVSLAACELLVVADFVLTGSNYTKQALGGFLRDHGMPAMPTRIVPLPHSLTVSRAGVEPRPDVPPMMRRKPYVLYVSAIEGRKNHLYVANAWRELIDQGVNVPDLVFVGRKIWRIGGLMDLLESTRHLGGRVHFVEDLSNAELGSVYAHCLFTVFTSDVEGWAGPVGESLAHGVPCVATNASSIPQIGGDFVDYVDPLNLREGIEVFRRLIEDADYRVARRKHIAADFAPRSWHEFGCDFFAAIDEAIAAEHPARSLHVSLPQGRKFAPGDLMTSPVSVSAYGKSPMRLAVLEAFYPLEHFGAWMRGSSGEITFATDLVAGDSVTVYLMIEVPDRGVGRELSLAINVDRQGVGTPSDDGPPATAVLPLGDAEAEGDTYLLQSAGRRLCRVRGRVGREGLMTVALTISGQVGAVGSDSREFAVGLNAIGYVADDDATLREWLIEQFIFTDLTPLR